MLASPRLRAAAIAAVTALAAVAAAPTVNAASTHDTGEEAEETRVPRVVVGTADSGINPYHDWFKVETSAVTQDVLDDFGIDADHIIHVSDSFLADEAAGVYADVVPGEAYWFAGTNVIAQADTSARPFIPDGSTHGVGVTSSIVAGNPEAIIYFAEGSGNIDDVFANPNVDIVSTSFGFVTGVPLFTIEGSYDAVVNNGKLYFGATPNDPSLQVNDNASGPWWVAGVAGFEEGTSEGKQIMSGSTPEFVADFTQQLPYCAFCTSEIDDNVGGTSFATPITAGTMSQVLLAARRATGHLGGISADGNLVDADGVTVTNWDLRRAAEQGAYVPGFAVNTDLVFDVVAAPVNPVAPYAQVGWGVVTPDPEHEVVEQTLAHLGFGDAPTRTKSADTCQFMTAQVMTRMIAWDLNPTGESFLDTTYLGGTDYQFC